MAGAKVLSDCLHNYDYERLPSVVEKIKEIEHHGDEMTPSHPDQAQPDIHHAI